MIKFLFACLLFLGSMSTLVGQFGISGQFVSYPLNSWEKLVDNNLHDVNYGVSVDYWTRLKNYRMEIIPTISANFGSNEIEYLTAEKANLQSYKFHLKNNFYLLDFKNDCNCPTFSKQNTFFKKSFFLQIAPGYSYNSLEISNSENIVSSDNLHLFELGLGVGFDIGLSDLVTITPYFNYVLTNSFSNNYLLPNENVEKTNLNHFLAGVRLGLRPDYARPSYKRRRAIR